MEFFLDIQLHSHSTTTLDEWTNIALLPIRSVLYRDTKEVNVTMSRGRYSVLDIQEQQSMPANFHRCTTIHGIGMNMLLILTWVLIFALAAPSALLGCTLRTCALMNEETSNRYEFAKLSILERFGRTQSNLESLYSDDSVVLDEYRSVIPSETIRLLRG